MPSYMKAPQEKINKDTLESDVMFHFSWCRKNRVASAGRYGVQGSFRDNKWQPMKSLPDFEGILMPNGRQFIADAKVCSGSSFAAKDDTKTSERQLRHLLERAEYGAICFFLIHWNARELKTRRERAWTCALPVNPRLEMWRQLESGEKKSVNRHEAEMYGHEVSWVVPDGNRKPVPDVVGWVQFAAKRLPEYALTSLRPSTPVADMEPMASVL